jgi:hypothetical protein
MRAANGVLPVIPGTPSAYKHHSSPFIRHFLLSFSVSSCYNPLEIQFKPSQFPAGKARKEVKGEHF